MSRKKDRTTEYAKGRIRAFGRSAFKLFAGSGLSQRIACTLIFVGFTLFYVLLLAPSTRTSDIVYSGIPIQMQTVPDALRGEITLRPGEVIEQTIIGTGETLDSVSVMLSFDNNTADGMYRMFLADSEGEIIAEYDFTAEGHTSPFAAALPLGEHETTKGEELALSIQSYQQNDEQMRVAVVSPEDIDISYPGLTHDGEADESVVLVSLISVVNKAPAWSLAILLICIVSPAVLCWRAPLSVNALVLILIFGCVFVFLTPINDSPDEIAHMARAFHMADGYWFEVPPQMGDVSSGTALYSGSIGQTFENTMMHSYTWANRPALGDLGANLYFLGYVPQTIGVFIGRIMGLDLAGIYYTGRLLNLLFYAVCAFFAVRMAPRFRLYLAVFAVMPMQIAICSTYNSDGMLYALSLLATGWFVRMYYDRSFSISVRDLVLFMIPCVLIGIKQYWVAPIAFLPFAIPVQRFVRSRTKLFCIVVAAGTLAATILSLGYSVVHELTDTAGGISGAGASVPDQLEFIASSPVVAARILAGSLARGLGDNLTQLFVFGRLTAQTPELVGMVYVGFIAVVAFSITRYQYDPAFTVGNTPSKTSTRIGVLIVSGATVVAIYFSTYLTWTPVGVNVVMGVQGRYLIPVLAYLPFLSFDCWPLVTKGVYMRSRLVTGLLAVLMLTASVMTVSFYTL